MNPPPDQRTITLNLTEADADAILDDLGVRLGHSVSEATRELYRTLRQTRRPTPREAIPHQRPAPADDIVYAPPQPVRPAPDRLPRRGAVVRKVDISGISGLGHIAEFCLFSDDAVAWRWLGGPPMDEPAWQIYDNKTTAPFVKISGHNDNTEIIWFDEEEPAEVLPDQ